MTHTSEHTACAAHVCVPSSRGKAECVVDSWWSADATALPPPNLNHPRCNIPHARAALWSSSRRTVHCQAVSALHSDRSKLLCSSSANSQPFSQLLYTSCPVSPYMQSAMSTGPLLTAASADTSRPSQSRQAVISSIICPLLVDPLTEQGQPYFCQDERDRCHSPLASGLSRTKAASPGCIHICCRCIRSR